MPAPTLAELKTQLNKTDSADDTELALYLSATLGQVEWMIGPLTVTSVTERYYSVTSDLALRKFPLVAVTSIKPVVDGVAGTAITATSYTADLTINEVRWHTPRARSNYEIVYTHGHATVSDGTKLAILLIAHNLWRVQNARFALNAPGEDMLSLAPGAGFLVPYRAMELLKPNMPEKQYMPGIA